MVRREFITSLGAAMAGAPLIFNQMSSMSHERVPIGIILNTVREEMKADYAGTLRKLKEYGYQYLEGGYQGPSAKEYKRLTDELGLRCIAGGSAMSGLQKELGQYLETAATLEYKYLVCYYPWLTSNDEISIEAGYQAADNLNQLGKRIKQEGFEFVWHNHNWEFFPRENGQRAFDIIMQNTDPEYVSLEMDLYWVFKGGADAIQELERYPGRTRIFHVKDMDTGPEQEIACVGEGKIDFKPILQYAAANDIDYWIIENETPRSSIKCAKNAIDHIHKIY